MDEYDEDPACPDCGGEGVVAEYIGTYGTLACHGPADVPCMTCEGTGEL